VTLGQLQRVNNSLTSDYVPYTGATNNLDMGSNNITTEDSLLISNGTDSNRMYTNENGTFIIKTNNGEFRFY